MIGELARALLERVIPRLGEYVLEVLETNTPAIGFYTRAGFRETRRLPCWAYSDRGAPRADLDVDLATLELDVRVPSS